MSTGTVYMPAPELPAARSGERPVTQRQVIRSEWIKLWSLRSSRWLFGLATLGLLLGIPVAAFAMAHWNTMPAASRATFSPIDTALTGWQLSQLGVGLLGILVICGEYSTGMIRSTMMAVPRRLPVLWAKIAVLAPVTFLSAVPMTFIGFYVSSAILQQHHLAPTLATPHALRAVIAVPVFLTLLMIFAISLGAIVRNIAGGLAIYAGLVFALPGLVAVLSTSLRTAVNPWLPSSAAMAFISAHPDPDEHLLHPFAGLGLFAGYTALLLTAAVITLARRDV